MTHTVKVRTADAAIYNVGNDRPVMKQAAYHHDGQWFYRVRKDTGHWGRWLECDSKPAGAWYDPTAGRARLPV